MSDINQYNLSGRLGADPELKTSSKGEYVRISIASNADYTDAHGEKVKHTQWMTGYLSDHCAQYALDYAHKGDKVYISGKLRKKKWIDKKTGEVRSTFVIKGWDFKVLFSKSKDNAQQLVKNPETSEASTKAEPDRERVLAPSDEEFCDDDTQDDIPF